MPPVCPRLKADGFCDDPECPNQHDTWTCEACQIICYSQHNYNAHLASKGHQRTVSGRNTVYHCALCSMTMVGSPVWQAHLNGKRHQKALARAASSGLAVAEPEQSADIPGYHFCSVCNRQIPNKIWARHPTNDLHRRKEQYQRYQSAFEEATKDKHGVTITASVFDFGILEHEEAQYTRTMSLAMENTVPSTKISIINVKLSSNLHSRLGHPSYFTASASATALAYKKPVDVVVTFKATNGGLYTDRVEVTFFDPQLNQQFAIVRAIKAIVGSKADYELLKPRAPYVPRTRNARQEELEVIPGEAPPALKAIPWVVKLPEAAIPSPLHSVLSKGSAGDVVRRMQSNFLPSTFESKTYARHFKHLLWAEEYRSERDLEIYDISNATLQRHNNFFYLEVPGLAEKRPSVLTGDRILVQKQGDTNGKWYEGLVHVIREKEVGMKFHQSFGSISASAKFTVRFKLNRYPLRRQHQALDTAFSPERLLFPPDAYVQGRQAASVGNLRLKVFNNLLSTNAAQLQAVSSIISLSKGALPFTLFGPPGTGKTITVVETIRQILHRDPTARILACAPSNSAADLIAQRLALYLSTDEMFRFYAPSRSKGQVPTTLLDYTSYDTYKLHFSVPPMARLKRFRLIVSTCVSASMPYGIGIARGHFSHIFVDEAGQATETEVMIPIKTIADNDTRVILSGDPKQLGPIIRSPVARQLGLEKSYLERLMERPAYDEVQCHGITVVKLVKNFRSHPSILKFPNERFYRGDLVTAGDPKVINAYVNSNILPAKGRKFPIIFHAISGKDEREASSPSFFNIAEATQVRRYVEALKGNRQVRTSDQEIGVISPYHAQCGKIRSVLRNVAEQVKVGSVEEFQGQERKVIIISTVRSSREFVEYDLKHTLGFLSSARRFNVAVTRAQALLIVVGDPNILSLDPLWRSFLNFVHVNGGWVGDAPGWDTDAEVAEVGGYDTELRDLGLSDMNEFMRRMEALTLSNASAEDGGEDVQQAEANFDRPWQEKE